MKFVRKQKKLVSLLSLFGIIFSMLLIVPGQAEDFTVDESIPAPSITEISPGAESVDIDWQASSALSAPAIRVDTEGKGDTTSITAALDLVQNGLIAVSAATYTETQFSIPAGVTLQGGYDPETWTWSPEQKTTLQSSGGGDAFVALGEGSSLKGFVISAEGTCAKNFMSGAVISNNVFQLCETGLALGANSYTDVANNTFLGNKIGIHLSGSASLSADGNVFSGVAEPFKNESSNPEIEMGASLNGSPTQLGLESVSPFPPDSGPATSVSDWQISLANDSSEKDLVSDVFRTGTPFSAMYVVYHLAEGDRFSIHSKDRYDLTIFDSYSREEKDFEGWIPVEETTEIRLRLRSNGDEQVAVYEEDGVSKTGDIGYVKEVGPYTMPSFDLSGQSPANANMGATGYSEVSSKQLSFPSQPEKMPSFQNIVIEEAKVGYLEELIDRYFKDGDEYIDRIILEGNKWKDFAAWPKNVDPGAEYISKAPYEVTDGRTINALLSSVFASSDRKVRRIIVGSRNGEIVPIQLPEEVELKAFLEQFDNLFLTTLTEWLKYRLEEVCFSDEGEMNVDCSPNLDFKYYVKPIPKLGEQDCLDAESCPLSPLLGRILEIHPFAAFLNRLDLYDYEQENYPVEFYVTDSPVVTETADGLRLDPGEYPYTGPLPEGDSFEVTNPAHIYFIYPEAVPSGRFQAMVKGTSPSYGKLGLFGIGDTRYEVLRGGESPFDAWRSWVEVLKYTGITAGKISAGNEDAYDAESFATYAGWDPSIWYNLSVAWGDGKVTIKREPISVYGQGPILNDLAMDDAGGRVPDNGRRHPSPVPAAVWEYPGKLTVDYFWLGAGNDLGGIPVRGTYNDVRIFAGEEDLLAEMYLRHDSQAGGLSFDVAKLRGEESYAARDPVPEGVINSGEIYAHLDNFGGLTKLAIEDGETKLELSKKTLAGQDYLVLSKEAEILAKTKWPNLGGPGRLELKWTYNQAVDQSSFFVFYALDSDDQEELILSNTEVFEGVSFPGMFIIEDPIVRVIASRVGPAKLVLRHESDPKTVTDLDKQVAIAGSEKVPDQSVGYKIYLGEDRETVRNRENGIFISADELADANAPSYSIDGLEEGQRYYLALSTVIVEEENRESNLSEIVSFISSPEFNFMPPEPRPAVVDGEMEAAAEEANGEETAWGTTLFPSAYAQDEPLTNSTEVANIYEIALGESLVLDGSLSEDQEGGQLSYEWSLGNTPSISFAKSPEKTFVYPGTYIAQYGVTDDQGAEKFAYSAPITIDPAPGDWVKASVNVWMIPREPLREWRGVQNATAISSMDPPLVGPGVPVYIMGEVLDLANVPFVPTKLVWDLDGKMLSWDADNGLIIEGSDRIKVLNEEEIAYLPATVTVSAKIEEVLQKTPLKVEFEEPGPRVISLLVEDEQGHQGIYQYSLYVRELQAYPARVSASSPLGGLLTIQGGTTPWLVDGEELAEGSYEKFVTFSPGTEILISDAAEQEVKCLVENPVAGEDPGLNKLPRLEIEFEKIAPVEKLPLKVRFKAESSDEDGYIASEGPWIFGDDTPHLFKAMLPTTSGIRGPSENPILETGPFEYMGKFFATLEVSDVLGNSKSRTIVIKVGPPDFSMQDVLGVTTSAVSRIEFLRKDANKRLEVFAETVPDENGIFINPSEEQWLAGKNGWELRDANGVLARVLDDYSFQLGKKTVLQVIYNSDEIKLAILVDGEKQGEFTYKGDPNEDIRIVNQIDEQQSGSQIVLGEGIEPAYKGVYTEFFRGEQKLFTFYNNSGLELAEGLSLKLKTIPIAETDLVRVVFQILEKETVLATLSLQTANTGEAIGENQFVEVNFSENLPSAGDEVFVAVYDKNGKRYLYPESFELPSEEESLKRGVVGLADGKKSVFFEKATPMVFAGNKLSVFGMLDPSSELEIIVDSNQVYTTATTQSGAFKQSLEILGEGSHRLEISWDKEHERYDFEIDQTPPSPPEATGLQAGRIVYGKAEPGSSVVGYSYGPLQDTATSEVLADGSFVLTFNDRAQKYRLKAYDSVMNFSEAVEVEFPSENVSVEEGFSFMKVATYLGAFLLLVAIIGLIRNKRKNNYWEGKIKRL
ncbi:MAG: PKD domain-containing protein [Candidatus Gracilibacteria bacterium]|nr:PKD domain-containing protein [Candidatus Gracilibacteria bacterium]